MDQVAMVRHTIIRFCHEFVEDPCLCYTERGQHSLFYTMLFNVLPEDRRYATCNGRRLCVLQNEYRTASDLSKSRRQHWDIALLQRPLQAVPDRPPAYDHLKLAAAVEFGMNVGQKHLMEDIRRLSHPEAHVGQGFVMHLYRLSQPGALFSNRDWSPNSKRILTPHRVSQLARDTQVEIYYGMHDSTRKHESGVWSTGQGVAKRLHGG